MSSARILVVDDTQTVRRAVVLMLESAGFECVEAGDGAEALGILRTEEIDLVLTDLYMPALDGRDLVERMRADGTTFLTPVLVLTTEGDPVVGDDLLRAGATRVLVKPMDRDALCAAIRECLPGAA